MTTNGIHSDLRYYGRVLWFWPFGSTTNSPLWRSECLQVNNNGVNSLIRQILWTFSIYLESVAIIPQFFLMMKSSETETVIAYYLIALGSYRALYILNWIYRYYIEQFYDNIADVAAIVQTFIFGLVFIRLAKMRKVPMGQLNAHSPTQVFTLPTPPTLGFQVPSDTEKLPQDPPPYEPWSESHLYYGLIGRHNKSFKLWPNYYYANVTWWNVASIYQFLSRLPFLI